MDHKTLGVRVSERGANASKLSELSILKPVRSGRRCDSVDVDVYFSLPA